MTYESKSENPAFTAFKVGYAGWLTYSIFKDVTGGFTWEGLKALFMLILAFMIVVFLFIFGSVSLIIWESLRQETRDLIYAACLTIPLGIISVVGYNCFIGWRNAKKKAAEKAEFNLMIKAKIKTGLEQLQLWVAQLDFQYYDAEKEKFIQWMFDSNNVINFASWDEAYRLYQLGQVTGRKYVCHMYERPQAWTREGKDLLWQAKRREQSERDKQKNAALKAARKSLINKK